MIDIVLLVLLLVVLIALVLVYLRMQAQTRALETLSGQLDSGLEAKHRAMLVDLHSGLTQQGDRLGGHLTDTSERLRGSVGVELKQTRIVVVESFGSSHDGILVSRAAKFKASTDFADYTD